METSLDLTAAAPRTTSGAQAEGPLKGTRILELAGIGPGPMCAMVLADLGATVLRIDRREPSGLGVARPLRHHYALRNRHAISLDLKSTAGHDAFLALVGSADALIEGFRPGVMERLRLGPDDCLERNPRLVYGRVSGWGQTGPLAHTAGHDINYLALTGVLDAIGRAGQPPTVPLNLLGDFAGGSLYLAIGVLAGVLRAREDGRGQVVDAAVVDGLSHLASSIHGFVDAGLWDGGRGGNVLDGGAFFYDVYRCSDDRWVGVGPIEPKFFAQLVERMDLDKELVAMHHDPTRWDDARAILATAFATRTRDAWCELLRGTDACVTPVLTFDEARSDPHLVARQTFAPIEGTLQPAPAPRFSRSQPHHPTAPAAVDEATETALAGWLTHEEIEAFQEAGTVRRTPPLERDRRHVTTAS